MDRLSCFRCGGKGHRARECRDPVRCFVCGMWGHKKYKCPSLRGSLVAPEIGAATEDSLSTSYSASNDECPDLNFYHNEAFLIARVFAKMMRTAMDRSPLDIALIEEAAHRFDRFYSHLYPDKFLKSPSPTIPSLSGNIAASAKVARGTQKTTNSGADLDFMVKSYGHEPAECSGYTDVMSMDPAVTCLTSRPAVHCSQEDDNPYTGSSSSLGDIYPLVELHHEGFQYKDLGMVDITAADALDTISMHNDELDICNKDSALLTVACNLGFSATNPKRASYDVCASAVRAHGLKNMVPDSVLYYPDASSSSLATGQFLYYSTELSTGEVNFSAIDKSLTTWTVDTCDCEDPSTYDPYRVAAPTDMAQLEADCDNLGLCSVVTSLSDAFPVYNSFEPLYLLPSPECEKLEICSMPLKNSVMKGREPRTVPIITRKVRKYVNSRKISRLTDVNPSTRLTKAVDAQEENCPLLTFNEEAGDMQEENCPVLSSNHMAVDVHDAVDVLDLESVSNSWSPDLKTTHEVASSAGIVAATRPPLGLLPKDGMLCLISDGFNLMVQTGLLKFDLKDTLYAPYGFMNLTLDPVLFGSYALEGSHCLTYSPGSHVFLPSECPSPQTFCSSVGVMPRKRGRKAKKSIDPTCLVRRSARLGSTTTLHQASLDSGAMTSTTQSGSGRNFDTFCFGA